MDIVETTLPGVSIVISAKAESRSIPASRDELRETDPRDLVRAQHLVFDVRGTVHGLMFSTSTAHSTRLLSVRSGEAFVVAVDIRPASMTSGEHITVNLRSGDRRFLSIPGGVAYGVCALDHSTEVIMRSHHDTGPTDEQGILWVDPDVGIDWPVEPEEAVVDERLWRYPRLNQLPRVRAHGTTANGRATLAALASSECVQSSLLHVAPAHPESALSWPEASIVKPSS